MSQKEPEQLNDLAGLTDQSSARRLVSRLTGPVIHWAHELFYGKEVTFDRLARETLNMTWWKASPHLTSTRIHFILANVVAGAPNDEDRQTAITMFDILSHPQKGALIRHTDEEPIYDETGEEILYTLKPDQQSEDLLREIAKGKPPVELILLYNQSA